MRVEFLELKEVGFIIEVTVLNTPPFSVYTHVLARQNSFPSKHSNSGLLAALFLKL